MDDNNKPKKKPEEFYSFKAMDITTAGSSLADFDPVALRDIPMPGMNAAAIQSKGAALLKDAMKMFDPVQGSIKAVCIAAKIIMKILIAMMKRPIAHYDPAMYCAHVMLYFRAPLNVSEKQTSILMRDILDNGNGLRQADGFLSYYRWLGIEPEDVNDSAWVASVVNKVRVLKGNVKYGFMNIDLATDHKVYDKLKKKFLTAVETTVLDTGMAALLPQYYKLVLNEGVPIVTALPFDAQDQALPAPPGLERVEGVGVGGAAAMGPGPGKPGAGEAAWGPGGVMTTEENLTKLINGFIDIGVERYKQRHVSFKAIDKQVEGLLADKERKRAKCGQKPWTDKQRSKAHSRLLAKKRAQWEAQHHFSTQLPPITADLENSIARQLLPDWCDGRGPPARDGADFNDPFAEEGDGSGSDGEGGGGGGSGGGGSGGGGSKRSSGKGSEGGGDDEKEGSDAGGDGDGEEGGGTDGGSDRGGQAVGESREGYDPEGATEVPKTREEIVAFLVHRFLQYDPHTVRPKRFEAPKLGPSIWLQMTNESGASKREDKIDFDWPEIPQGDIDQRKPTVRDITDADVCTAVVRAYNANMIRRSEALTAARSARSARLLAARAQALRREALPGRAAALQRAMEQFRERLRRPAAYDEGPVFRAALEDPMWEAAGVKVGGAAGVALMTRLRAAVEEGRLPAVGDPLALAKALGDKVLEQPGGVFLSHLEAQLGVPLPAGVREELKQAMPEGMDMGGGEGAAAGADGKGALDAASYLGRAEEELGSDVSDMLATLQQAVSGLGLGPLDAEALAADLLQRVQDMGAQGVLEAVEARLGAALPESVRREVEKVRRLGEGEDVRRLRVRLPRGPGLRGGGVGAAMGCCSLVAGGWAVAVAAGAVDALQAAVAERLEAAEAAADALAAGDVVAAAGAAGAVGEVAAAALSGDAAGALEAALEGDMLPMPRAVREAAGQVAAVQEQLAAAEQLLGAAADPAKLVEAQAAALTGSAEGALDALEGGLAGGLGEALDTAATAIEDATDLFAAGMEIALSVDAQALTSALEDANEMFMAILEILSIDDFM
ncbi:hypothetical protein HYH03_005856 [Edaphochlamys debaryana]|uniref:Uncharacterized protein n=1 Tax=Edaphochlamys debaryana TaxID=47281 RepID=A0A836C1V5_9CHLO|nr:hypothetical protein HYH03_005856 [Edaphochlamys debaryana]|eukprot:KAG2495924.1 hypothetical protein HYH03_005856 [Edaphochlamys debaryana]